MESVTQRFYPVNPDFRNPFSRDRDRIIHSSYFRRLEYKTQVFLNHSGDYFRTRLTHSLEVSQIARTLATHLGLNAELAEAIALAHDLGHTPFGHAGGDELDKVMRKYGYSNGFEHNFQSFRVVTKLEKRYKDFDGLNLTFATLEGILKHSYPYEKPFLKENLKATFQLEFHPSLEAILVDLSDEIAYLSHDIDDGIKYGLIDFDTLRDSALVNRAIIYVEEVEKIGCKDSIFRHRFTSRLITILVYDILENNAVFHQEIPQCFKYNAAEPLPLTHTKEMEKEIKVLKKILFQSLYRHEEIAKKMFMGKRCVRKLYECFNDETSLLPKDLQKRIQNGEKTHRICADYIASMTDRYAIALYEELGF
ncbi:deoxyguanosinetriphosphate triphosphohydrolase [Helicobacter turcicus]|uniref:Deoxyguanosinetriphosphate triphosphohydrolase-like protein n=1 Tax=Helicobacter turcicus TaxID=2867412 RepID=A0ABS7JPW7_9HELI|nr:deoxyguanosinetriphosphate triphosphohydrolase [Helicobacter turcicus]MBX7491437.1 deoxyguanosinetriphosphate triphosphohydrolase [Helicobacter turcicus]MBX7545897.1 deoxyguanosinetriphosphate triphosphohydrolase [Helicobacter turcicus]